MVWQSESNGKWYFSFEGGALEFDTEQEARQAMATANEQTGEAVILAAIDKLIPILRDAFKELIALQNTWSVNDISASVAAALAANEDVENTPATRLYALGVVFTELFTFLNTPIASVGITPNQALNRINWRNFTLPTGGNQ